MADLNLDWGSDLSFTAGGDLALADNELLTRQRIQRRLFTAVRGYLWHLEYGAGLPQKIGHVGTTTIIQSLIRANIAIEASVAPYPLPQVTVTQDTSNPGLWVILIVYFDATLGEQVTLSFDTTGQSVAPALLLG
jgi:hypothetical protein